MYRLRFHPSLLAGVALAWLLLAAPVPAAADAAAGSAALPPTVSFVEQGPLVLSKEKLGSLAGAKAASLGVRVHNDLRVPQLVTLELTGLPESAEPDVAALFPTPSQTLLIGPGGTRKFTLELDRPSSGLPKEDLAGELLAYGRSGGISRRAFKVTFPGPREAAGENALSPKRVVDVTLTAVNYLPSLLSNLFTLALVLVLGLVLAAWRFREWLKAKAKQLPYLFAALALLLVILGVLGIHRNGIWNPVSWHAISAQPIELAPTADSGTRGTVTSENGTIAQLEASGRKLRPEHLSGAAEYTGKYGLSDEEDAPEASATVRVRDFWIWAVIAIALGLAVGYAMHRWFQVRRPKAKLRSRLERTIYNYTQDLEDLWSRDRAKPFKDTTIDGRISAREDQVHTLLDNGETTAATEKILALDRYIDRFFNLRESLHDLDTALDELAAVAGLTKLDFLDLDEAAGYQEARRILAAPVDSGSLDADEEDLKGRGTEIAARTKLTRQTKARLKSALDHMLLIEKLEGQAHDTEATKLGEVRGKVISAARAALQAEDGEALGKAKGEDDAAYRELEALREAISKYVEVPKPERIESLRAFLADAPTGPGAPAVILERALGESAESAGKATIDWSVTVDGKPEKETIHVSDRVQFQISLTGGDPRPHREVEVDFGDGRRKKITPRGEGEPLRVVHAYRSSKPTTVVVRSVPDGKNLGEETLPTINREPRVLELEDDLKRKDNLVNEAAFVLAVGSGMVALYLGNPTWGEPTDYLSAFLWGGITGEGFKFAAALADRVWPAS